MSPKESLIDMRTIGHQVSDSNAFHCSIHDCLEHSLGILSRLDFFPKSSRWHEVVSLLPLLWIDDGSVGLCQAGHQWSGSGSGFRNGIGPGFRYPTLT